MIHKQPQVVKSDTHSNLKFCHGNPRESESVVESKKILLACLESPSLSQSAGKAADKLINKRTNPKDAHSTWLQEQEESICSHAWCEGGGAVAVAAVIPWSWASSKG